MLKAEHLTYIYGAGTPFERRALDDISFSVQAGEIAGLIGHTGSGKSTLAQHLNALLKPLSGRVLLDGTDIWDKKDARNARFQVGLVFQYPEYQLFEETVYKDIAFGVKNKGVEEADGKRRQPTEIELDISVYSAMDFVHLPRELADKSPFELSGGQKRRAAIAGVIAMMPKVLILDEPTAGLDPQGRREILGHIKAYRDATGASVVLISHSMDEVARLADSITVLSEGKTAMSGTPRAVFGRADELEALHLSVPAFTKVFRLLREMGVDIDDGCYTAEAAEAELLRVKSAVSRGAGEETC